MLRLNWVDQFLLLVLLVLLGFIGYDRYVNYSTRPAVPPPPPLKYNTDVVRRAEIDRIAVRLQISGPDWSTLIVLPHPRCQGPTQDDFMKCCESGELAPLVGHTARFTYVEGIHEIPKKWDPWLAKRDKPTSLLFVIFRKDQPVYWELVPPDTNKTANGTLWVYHVVDDVIATLHRWMSQQ